MKGTTLGPYRLDRELGSGGMGKVYAAVVEGRTALAEGTVVALKVVHPHLLDTPGFFKRFLREAEVGKAVVHENVVRTLDCDAVGGAHFLVMEYVEGQTLRALLAELDRVPEELCRHIGREVARGLAAIHAAGVVHRDLKPENVLITADRHTVKVMDLGVARLAEETIRLSQSGAFVGSVEYAAPEQFGLARAVGGRQAGDRSDAVPDVGFAADLHALGLVLYELSTGQHPFRADDFRTVMRRVLDERPRRPAEVNPQLSPFFEELVLQLLEKDPARRVGSAADLAQILDEGERSSWWKEKAKAIRTTTKRPLRRIRIPRETALYGRDVELAKLRALYDKAKAGEGQVLLVEGEAGIGKSRLLDEFVGLLQREGEDLNFLWGSYPPGGAATASGAFSTAYREHFGGEALEETLPAYLVETPILVPAFAALLRGETTPTGAEPLTKDSLQTVFVHATRALARERTTIVLVEDLHFAPEEGRALFASLALATPGHRILLVGTTRPGIDEKWFAGIQRVGAERMPLARLGPKDLARLLTDAFHSEALATELAGRVGIKSDGNPFFAFEIIRGLREGQFITKRDDGTWVTTRVFGDLQIPSSVLDLVNARVADLDDDERNLLDVASCCGFEFDPILVGQVLGLQRIPVMQALAKVEKRHRLVRSSGRRYVFDHHQVQEALYGALAEILREEYHAAIAEALESQHGAATADPATLDGALCVDLAEHFLKGAQGPKALRYFDAALTHLEKNYLNDTAIRVAERALAVPGLLAGPKRVAVLLRLAARFSFLGRREAERATIEEALALARATGDRCGEADATGNLGVLLRFVGCYAEAKAAFERDLAISREIGDRQGEANATCNMGTVLHSMGRYDEAREHFERYLAIAREIGDRKGVVAATGNLGVLHRSQGRLNEAKECIEQCLVLAREMGDRRSEAMAVGNMGVLLLSTGCLVEAREHTERCLALARATGDRRNEALAMTNLATVFLSLGRPEEAQGSADRSLALHREMADRAGEAHVHGILGEIFLSLGRCAAAQEQHERHLALSREVGDRHNEALATRNLGNLLLSVGRYAEALALIERHIALARTIGERQSQVHAMGNLGNVLVALGRTAEARWQYSECLALARAIGDRHSEAVGAGNLGELLCVLGRHTEAREHLDRYLVFARETGARPGEGSALVSLAESAAEAGDVQLAERLLVESLAVRRSTGARSEEAKSLVVRGSLLAREGRTNEARADLDAALAIARELSLRGVELAASAHLARLPGGDVGATLAALAAHGERVELRTLMDARFRLWQATHDSAHLAESKRLLDFMVEHAPPECRESMLTNVRLHREIVAAAKEHGL